MAPEPMITMLFGRGREKSMISFDVMTFLWSTLNAAISAGSLPTATTMFSAVTVFFTLPLSTSMVCASSSVARPLTTSMPRLFFHSIASSPNPRPLITAFFRLSMALKSTLTADMSTLIPNAFASLIDAYRLADAMSAFVGMQPRFTHVPPDPLRVRPSIRHTFLPRSAHRIAVADPPGPPPMHTTSYSYITCYPSF